jgi:tetratricopeptide (TPR) repeat protein
LNYLEGQLRSAIADCDEAIRLQSKCAMALDIRGAAYLALGQYDEATADFGAAIAFNPRDLAARNNLGVAYQKQKYPDAAIRCYAQAMLVDTNDATAIRNLGLVYLDKTRSQFDLDSTVRPNIGTRRTPEEVEALEQLRRASELYPSDAGIRYDLGMAHFSAADFHNAIDRFTEAIRNQPDLAEAYFYRGHAYRFLGQTSEAKADFEESQRISAAQGDHKAADRARRAALAAQTAATAAARPTAAAAARSSEATRQSTFAPTPSEGR